jgi:putative glutamine amidotransferase
VKIGITRTENAERQKLYVEWLKGSDDIEVITLNAADNSAQDIKGYDALVLSGGVDVHPKYYGKSTDYPGAPSAFRENRDEFEIAIFRAAQENNLPVLGICRGLQLINVIHNGTLIQDLGDDTLNKIHRGGPDKDHAVTIQPGTILHDIIGADKAQINSAHHQGVDKVGDGLRVSAIAADGVVEGIERKDPSGKPFLLAVQWHPERMSVFHLENTAAAQSLRDHFIQEIKKSIPVK